MKITKIVIIAIICMVLFAGVASASYTITGGGSVSNTNIKGGSSQYDVGPSGTSGVSTSGIVHNTGEYIYATGVTLDVADETGSTITFDRTISSQRGASVTHSDSTNLINGGYSYGDGTSGGGNVHTYPDTTERTATYTVANDLQSLSYTASTTVFMLKAPTITAVSVIPSEGGPSTTFTGTVEATSSSGAMTYQWYQSSNSGSTWNAIPGATSDTSTFTLATAATYKFKVVVTDSAGSADSYEAFPNVTATVYNPPSVTVSADKSEGPLSTTISLSATASGQGTLTYQWKQSTDGTTYTDISGATQATYSAVISDAAATLHYYQVAVTGTGGTTTSNAVTYQSVNAPTVTASADKTDGALQSSVTLTSTATGSGTLTYQWYEGSSAITGATQPSYTANLTDSVGTTHIYHIVVSDAYGQSATSNDVIYTTYSGPGISAVSANPTEGGLVQTVNLSVTATGSGTLTYQWYEGSSAIAGATNATYQATVNDSVATTHTYHAVVTDQYNQTATSNDVTYQSYAAPVISSISASPTNGPLMQNVTLTAVVSGATSYQWYEGTSAITGATNTTYQATVNDSVATTHTYTLRATGIGGTTDSTAVTYQSYAAPVFSSIEVSPALGPNPLTITATATASDTTTYTWYTSDDQSTWEQIGVGQSINYTYSELGTNYVKCVASGVGGTTDSTVEQVRIIDGVVTITDVSVSPSAGPLGTTYNLSVTASAIQGASITGYQWYISTDTVNWSPITTTQTATYTPTEAGSYYYKVVITDSLGLTTDSYAGGFTSAIGDVIQITSATAAIDSTEGPLNKTINLTATGTIIPSGTALTYQWYEGTSAITGATNATYQATINDSVATTHTYKVVISSNGSSLESNTVTYQSYATPIISNVSASPTEGPLTQDVTLTAVVSGATSYQWYEGTSAITGATNSSYTVHITDNSAATHTYTLEATGIGGTTTSNAVTYQSYGAPVISSVSASPTQGPMNNTITLSANVSGADSYVWQENVAGSWNTIGTTVPLSKTITDSTATTHTYRLQATGIGGTATSTTVTYQSYTQPVISGTAVSPTIGKATETLTLSANVTGAVSLQWQISNDGTTWTNIAGATSNPYTQEFVTTQSNTYFRLSATNVAGTSYGNSVTYQRYPPATVTITADSTLVPAPGSGKLTATGSNIESYQWQEELNDVWTNITGATNAVYEPYFSDSGTHIYRVAVTGQDGNIVTSNTISIETGSTPNVTITSPATGTSVHLGTPFQVTATVDNYTSFKWDIDGGQIVSQTSNFDIMVRMNDSGDHTIRLIAYNGFGETSRAIHVIVSTSIRQAATSPVAKVEESMGAGILGYVANASTPGPDGQPDLMATFTGLLNPYENIMAAWFYLLLFAVPYLIIWIRQKNTIIPSILGILFATFILVKFPATAIPVAIILLVLSISGGIYGIYVKMQR